MGPGNTGLGVFRAMRVRLGRMGSGRESSQAGHPCSLIDRKALRGTCGRCRVDVSSLLRGCSARGHRRGERENSNASEAADAQGQTRELERMGVNRH